MSYRTWSTYGYGFCVDDIKTTPERLLKLASEDEKLLKFVRDYLNAIFDGNYNDEDLKIEDFDDLEGDYGERGLTYILKTVINEFDTCFADDFECTPYILYTPTFPWWMKEDEILLTEEDIKNTFQKYISILTDEEVKIDYYDIENGG